MENLCDTELLEIFNLCDHDGRGWITAGSFRSIHSDEESLGQVLTLLGLGPNDKLDFEEFVTRVRKIEVSGQRDLSNCSTSNSEVSSPASSMTIDNTESGGQSFESSTISASPLPNKIPKQLPRFMTSSRAALTSRRSSDFSLVAAAELDGIDNVDNVFLPSVIQNIAGKVDNLTEIQQDNQIELKSLLSRLYENFQADNNRRWEQMISSIEDKMSTTKLKLDEDKQLRSQLDQLDSEKRIRAVELSSLRDRVLELSHSLQLRDEELTRERRQSDDLRIRLSKAETELHHVTDERFQLRSVNKALMSKVETLIREKDDMMALKDFLQHEQSRIDKEKAELAYERLVLARERHQAHGKTGNYKLPAGVNLNLDEIRRRSDIEEDFDNPVVFHQPTSGLPGVYMKRGDQTRVLSLFEEINRSDPRTDLPDRSAMTQTQTR